MSYSQKVLVEGDPNATPVPVSGTVAMSGTTSVIAPNGIGTYGVLSPGISGVYLFSINDVPGVVAANNFLTLTNPVGSGKTIFMPYVAVSSYAATGTASVNNSLIISMATGVSGGTDGSASIISFSDSYPAPSGVVRSGNPTATVGSPLIGVPPAIISGSGVSVTLLASLEANAAAGTKALTEGNSFLLRTTAGDTDQRWNFTIAWLEF